jgi:hypothetical protein
MLIQQLPTLRTIVLVIIAIWSFCRFYYFAFYVVERHVDPAYRFSGLISLLRHFFSNRQKPT